MRVAARRREVVFYFHVHVNRVENAQGVVLIAQAGFILFPIRIILFPLRSFSGQLPLQLRHAGVRRQGRGHGSTPCSGSELFT